MARRDVAMIRLVRECTEQREEFGLDAGQTADVIDLLEVSPDAQGGEIGSQLVRRVQQEAAVEGRSVTLTVLKANPRAKALYERLGFTASAEAPERFFMRWDPE